MTRTARIATVTGTGELRLVAHPENAAVAPYRDRLDIRENEILDCILSGWSQEDIADELNISRSYVANICAGSIRMKMACPDGKHLRKWLRELVEQQNCNLVR